MTQVKIPFREKEPPRFKPKKGMSVEPIPGKLVPSSVINGWKTGMVYNVMQGTEDGVDEVVIRGIVNGKEFHTLEFSDNIQERL